MAKLNGVKVNNARYVNADVINTSIAAGINPKNGAPLRIRDEGDLSGDLFKIIAINDEQAAINAFTWYNLPKGLDGNLIERILYYRGQGMLFYMESVDRWFFLPFVLGSKGIDVYGRFINTSPLPFNGTSADKKESPWIKGLEFDVVYDIEEEQDFDESKCFLLSDFSKQISQTNIARKILNDPLIKFESELLPFVRTNLLNGTGVSGMRVQNQDEANEVLLASESINKAAKGGKKYIPIIGKLDFQDLTGGSLANVNEYLMSMQAVDNFRLTTHGMDSGGIFQKQAHMLESENQMNERKSSFVLDDKKYQRARFCDLVNSMTDLGIWCEPNEDVATEETYEEEEPTEEEGVTDNADE